MSTKTAHIGLDKLDSTDLVVRTQFNSNMDLLDTEITDLKEKEAALTTELDEVQESLTGFVTKDDLDALTGEVDSLENSIAAINNVLSDQATRNAAFDQQDQELQSEIESIQAAIAARKDERVVTFRGSGVEVRYPWEGAVQQIQINCATARATDINFQVERQAKADYEAARGLWQKLGGQTLNMPPGKVYMEYTVTDTLSAGDVLRFITQNDDSDITVEVFIHNN